VRILIASSLVDPGLPMMPCSHCVTALVPCNNLDASEAFYARLGFTQHQNYGEYRILWDGKGGAIHLTMATEGWLVPGRNPFAVYLYTENVDKLAAALGRKPEDKPWGMYEFSVSDPDETLVRIGWPTRLRNTS
jgi:catechol 2,3-dioxygenase-like lactoylglutathione lyase family enzyme